MHRCLFQVLPCSLPAALAATVLVLSLHAPAHADAAAPLQVCGVVDLGSTSSTDAARAFDCFNKAFASCSSATLQAVGQEAGTPTTWTFTTLDSGAYDHACSVSEVMETQGGGANTTGTYLCKIVVRGNDSLRFSGCGSQKDVTLRVGT